MAATVSERAAGTQLGDESSTIEVRYNKTHNNNNNDYCIKKCGCA